MFAYKYLIYFSILISFISYSSAAVVVQDNKYISAADLPRCDGNNALGDCIKEIIDILIPRLKDGNKELDIIPLDPLVLNRTVLRYASKTANGRISLKGATVTGVSKLYHKSVEFKIDKNGQGAGHTIAVIPKLNVVGAFKANFELNNVKLQPQGNFNLTLTEVVVDTDLDGEIYEKDGQRFFRVVNYHSDPVATDFHIDASGIFEDRELNDAILTLINSSWRDIFENILPETRKYWAPVVKRILNEGLSKVPIDAFADNV